MLIEQNILLFKEILYSNLLLSVEHTVIFYAVQVLHTDYLLVIGVVFLGTTIALTINYFLGRIFYYYYKNFLQKSSHKQVKKVKKFHDSDKLMTLFLALSFLPVIGKMLIFFAGTNRFSYIKSIVICTISRLLYYYLILS